MPLYYLYDEIQKYRQAVAKDNTTTTIITIMYY